MENAPEIKDKNSKTASRKFLITGIDLVEPDESNGLEKNVTPLSGRLPEIRKKEFPKRFEEYKKTESWQQSLFTDLPEDRSSYSRSIALYDTIPKFMWNGQGEARIQDEFLRPLEREFTFDKKIYKITVFPATIREKGKMIAYFPGITEECVEDALRKLVIESKENLNFDDKVGFSFALHSLQAELKRSGKKYSKVRIKKALKILSHTRIHLHIEDDPELYWVIYPLENFGITGKGAKNHFFATFNRIISENIRKGDYRLLDYKTIMSYKSYIAKRIHKRISHNFTCARTDNRFWMLLTTMIKDFGMNEEIEIRYYKRDVCKALEELKDAKVLLQYGFDDVFDEKNTKKLVDCKFTLICSTKFITDVIEANREIKQIRKILDLENSLFENVN